MESVDRNHNELAEAAGNRCSVRLERFAFVETSGAARAAKVARKKRVGRNALADQRFVRIPSNRFDNTRKLVAGR